MNEVALPSPFPYSDASQGGGEAWQLIADASFWWIDLAFAATALFLSESIFLHRRPCQLQSLLPMLLHRQPNHLPVRPAGTISEAMRTLIVSDKVEPILYSGAIQERVGEIDLVLSCGDLPFYYIEFIVSMLNRPSYYVFGNHGREVEYQGGDWKKKTAPQGAENLHLKTHKAGSLLLAGLEGSMRYNNAPKFQYTDEEMWLNVARIIPQLAYNKIRFGRWMDVLVAHSPPAGIHDEHDRPHQGFKSFLALMRWFRPRYLLHGHIHIYRQDTITHTRYHDTDVINVYPYKILDLEPQVSR